MPDNLDNAPSEFSELDLSEDAAITGDDVQTNLGVEEGDSVRPDAGLTSASDPEEDLEEGITEA